MSITLTGQYYPKGSSTCEQVDVHLADNATVSFTSKTNERISAHLSELHVNAKLGNIPREIILPRTGLLMLECSVQVDDWLDGAGQTQGLAKIERSRAFILAAVIAVPLFLYLSFKVFIPWGAVYFAEHVPDVVVQTASRHTLASLDQTILAPSELDTQTQNRLTARWHDVVNLLASEQINYTFEFRQSSIMGPNAFALPNGTIVFTDEMIALVDADEAMLTAIMLHEIGHVERRHSMRLIAQSIATAVAVDYFLGDLGAALEAFIGIGTTIVDNSFSRELETEADDYALSRLAAVELSTEDFANAFEKLATVVGEQGDIERLLSSHPSIKERIEKAREAVNQPPPRSASDNESARSVKQQP